MIEYQFLNYRISPDQQVLFRDSQRLEINTKAYQLLLTFVKNQGQVLRKDILMEAVWPGQVVTDAALTKQILRLRQLIDDNDSENPIIETHRGAGYRLRVPVHRIEKPDHLLTTQPKSGKGLKFWLALAVLALLLPTVVILKQHFSNITPEKPASTQLLLLPANNDSGALNPGYFKYLAALLKRQSNISSLYLKQSWQHNKSPETLAIDLTSKGQSKYACLIQYTKSDQRHVLTLKIRDQSKILASTEFQAEQIMPALKSAANWIIEQLVFDEAIKANPLARDIGFTSDNYALESYLLGVSERVTAHNLSKAKEYFEIAVTKDPTFTEAWLNLAEIKTELGEFEAADSIADTQLSKLENGENSGAAFGFYFTKALANYRLQRPQKSEQSLQKALEVISHNNTPADQMQGYRSLLFLAYISNDWPLALEHLEKQTQLIQDYFPVSEELGRVNYMKAEILSNQLKSTQARNALEKAVFYFSQEKNPRYMMSVYSLMNRINLNLSEYDQGLEVANEAEIYLDHTSSVIPTQYYLMSTAMIFNLRGHFDLSRNYIERLRKMGDQSGQKLFYIYANMLKMHTFYVQNKFEEAYRYATAIENSIDRDFLLEESSIFDRWLMIIASRVEAPENALKRLEDMQRKFPAYFSGESQGNEMIRAKGHIQARLGQIEDGVNTLLEVEQAYREIGELHLANYVGFEILEIMLAHPEAKVNPQAVIDRIDQYTKYDYLYFKLKAAFSARRGEFLLALQLMQENKLKANQLWTAEDQLQLESYQRQVRQ